MSDDAHEHRDELRPPRSASEAELAWQAPAAGYTHRVGMVLFAQLILAAIFCVGGVFLLAALFVIPALILMALLLVPSHHWLGPGGVTIRLPFGTLSHPWSEFSEFRVEGNRVYLGHPAPPRRPPLLLNTRDNVEQVAGYVQRYVPEATSDESATLDEWDEPDV